MVQAASWQFANCSEGVGRAEFHAEGASADQWFVEEANGKEPGSGDALNSMAVFTSADHF